MEAAASSTVNLAKDEVLTASISSEDSDSWTWLGKNADQLDKEPSGVEIVKTESEAIITVYSEGKQRHDSQRSNDSQLDESSDGISIISESDRTCYEKLLLTDDLNDEYVIGSVHFKEKISLKSADYELPTPPFTPEEVKLHEEDKIIDNLLQVQPKSKEDTLETIESVVEHRQRVAVNFSSWIIFSVLAAAMAAVILGNAMRLQNRVDKINFEHEKRISELELENNILKNEMNKLRHLYTRSELDEQVQRAEFEWMETFNQQHVEDPAEIDQPETPAAQQPPIRKVPPQDSGVKRKIVWSGDEEEPMLIVDKDYILPAFCYNRDQAVQDDLFFEYSAKYCDVRKRKIEAKQKKAEFEAKRLPKKEDYNEFIQQVPIESVEDRASFDPGKLVSPFNIDYKKAFDAIKSEGSVIVEALGNIFDLSPDPEEMFKSKVVGISKPIEEAPPLSENQMQNEPYGQTSNQRMEQESNVENFHKNGKKVHQNDWKVDDSLHGKYRKESQILRQKSEKFQMSSQKQPSQQLRQEHDFTKHSRSEGNNNGDINYEREDAHHKQHVDARYKEYGQKSNGGPHDSSGKRQKKDHSGAGSPEYDQKFNGRQESSEKRLKQDHSGGDSPKHHKKHYDQQKHGEWTEKRYKGREEYRQNGEQKDGEWHDKRYKGREEYRRKDEQQPRELHYKRYKKKEAYSLNSEQNSGEWHDQRYKGREEYRQHGDRHGERKGSEERKWYD